MYFLFSLKFNSNPHIIDPQRSITHILRDAAQITVNLFSQAHIGIFCSLFFIY